jgi:hypothetical protein
LRTSPFLHFVTGSAGALFPPPAAKVIELPDVTRKAARERYISFFMVDLHDLRVRELA